MRTVRMSFGRADADVTALDRQHDIARCRGFRAGDVEIDAQLLADHARRIDDVGLGIKGEARGKRVQHRTPWAGSVRARRFQNTVHVRRRD